MIFHPVGVRMDKRLCKRHTAAVPMKEAKLQLRDCPPRLPRAESQGKVQLLALSAHATHQMVTFHPSGVWVTIGFASITEQQCPSQGQAAAL